MQHNSLSAAGYSRGGILLEPVGALLATALSESQTYYLLTVRGPGQEPSALGWSLLDATRNS